MEIDKLKTNHSLIITKGDLGEKVGQIKLYKNLYNNNQCLKPLIIFPSKNHPTELCLKINNDLLDHLLNSLGTLNIDYTILPPLIYFFATNLPYNVSDKIIQTLLTEVYAKSIFMRLTKDPRCGFMGIPNYIVDSNKNLQQALLTNEGIPIELPSLKPIYLRPRHQKNRKPSRVQVVPTKKISHSSTYASISGKSHTQSYTSNNLPTPIASNNIQSEIFTNLENRMNSLESHMETRLKKLEDERSENTKAIEKLSTDIGNLTISISNLIKTLSPQKQSQRCKRPFSSPESESMNSENLQPEYSPVEQPIAKRQKMPLSMEVQNIQKNTREVSLLDFQILQSMKSAQQKTTERLESKLKAYFQDENDR